MPAAWAHIRSKTARGVSLCGVNLNHDEFGFDDAKYAAQFYASGDKFRACTECVTWEREHGDKR